MKIALLIAVSLSLFMTANAVVAILARPMIPRSRAARRILS